MNVQQAERGHLKPQPKLGTLAIETPLPENSHLLERVIEQAVGTSGKINRVRVSVRSVTNQISDRLQSLGLLVTARQAKAAQQLPATVVFAVLLLGISKILVGISRGKPVGFLVALCVITTIIGCCFLYVPVFRSRYGDRVLAKLRTQHANLRRNQAIYSSQASSQTDPQLAMAFALFGAEVLADSSLSDLQQVLTSPVSSTGESPVSSTAGGGDSGGWYGGGDSGGGGSSGGWWGGGDSGNCGDGGGGDGGGSGGGGSGCGGCGGCGGG